MGLYELGMLLAFTVSAILASIIVLKERYEQNSDLGDIAFVTFLCALGIVVATLSSWLFVALIAIFTTTKHFYNKSKENK